MTSEMKKISSSFTFYYKRIFPLLWFGILAFLVVTAIWNGTFLREPAFLLMPLAMGIFGFLLMSKLAWDLADEVQDGGDYLLVGNRGEQDKIFLTDIMNVGVTTMMNPPRITLRLRKISKFGKEVSFSPVAGIRFNPFARNAVAEDLIVRVDRARLKHD